MPIKVWVVAAGTGGHIFPGLNLARALEAELPEEKFEFLFFGTRDRLEARIVPQQGRPIFFLRAGAWKGVGRLARLGGLFSLVAGFFQVLGQVCKARPQLLISVGGYVSVPVALAAKLAGVPLYLIEPNIRAGLANRLLSRVARRAFTVPGSDASKKFSCPVEELGNPIREDLSPQAPREKARQVLVLGGSQGALSLCQESLAAAAQLRFGERGLRLVLQTGEKNLEAAAKMKKEKGLGTEVELRAFIDDVPAALAQADVIVARAGAMTVSELSAVALPTIFVPFPFAADNHQWVNAKLLADDGAALLVDEREPDFAGRLRKALETLCLGAASERRALAERFRRWGRPRAAREIARCILNELIFS